MAVASVRRWGVVECARDRHYQKRVSAISSVRIDQNSRKELPGLFDFGKKRSAVYVAVMHLSFKVGH